MTRILILSDIHIPSQLNEFPYQEIQKTANEIDLVFGLGDYIIKSSLDYLYAFNKDVYAVCGNMDDPIIKSELSSKIQIKIENITIGLIHGWGLPNGLREKILKEFNQINIICYGHTHVPYQGYLASTLFINPGSLCGSNPSYGILTINHGKINFDIIYLK